MTVYHIVLFTLKPSATKEQVSELKDAANSMVGQIPGLTKMEVGPPLGSTAARAQGFDYGLIAVLEKPEDVKVYAEHPVHQKVHEIRESLCDDTLAYDLVA
ncbi:hypothetical protein LTR37_006956 [Vermiconidia calcicola]|uniref:Uncharacterized protein n=1 Tax=Vermiconidia calcicola TaxID=1690605 RepID=A0ACC3NF83_9PEZI|nr:hypothetical protein LTR37_006956 [Vermiconidia calcicola]